MSSCDQSTSSNGSSPNATSATPPPPPCTLAYSLSGIIFFSTIAGFIIVVFATGLLVYIFHRLGWLVVPEPAPTARPAVAARLLILRESASIANASQGLDPEVIRSFPVYTFCDKFDGRDVTPDANGLASVCRISHEIPRSVDSSRRTSNDDELVKESTGENGSTRGKFVVTIESDEVVMTGLRECAVCLGEYAAGERIKVVPACAHGFHADCIDLWLATKTTCPICRTDLKPEAPITQQGDSQVVVTATGRGVTEGTGGEETAAVPPGAAIDSSSSGG